MKYFLPSLLILIISCNRQISRDYFVFLHSDPGKPVISEDSALKLQQGHIANINRLYSEGKLTAAGPFDGGGGLFLLNAGTLKEAHDLLNTDPAVQAKRFITEIHPFIFETGSVCKLDSGFEMTSYHFTHFKSIRGKNLTKKEKEIYHQRINIPGSRIIMEGYFPDTHSRILISDTSGIDHFDEKINPLENSLKHIYRIDCKSLWIARGTFCEDTSLVLNENN